MSDNKFEDIGEFIMGRDNVDGLSTGAMAGGTLLAAKGLIMGDIDDIVIGAVAGGTGLLARFGRIGYRAIKAFRASRAATAAEPKVEAVVPNIPQAQENLTHVQQAQGVDATALTLEKAAAELGINKDKWVQISGQVKDSRANKPNVLLYNAVVKHAELACDTAGAK